jgi:hypothetical protein
MVQQVGNRAARRSRRERWRGLIAEWSGSGQTQAAFCRARGLNAGTFAWWKRQWRREERAAAGSTVRRGRRPRVPGRFVEVRLGGVAAASSYEIVLSCGRAIRVPDG